MSLESAIQHLLNAKRISAPSQSYRKDNPNEYAKVKAYLEGGARPTGVVTEMGVGLVEVEDERRNVTPPPDPPPPDPGPWQGPITITQGGTYTGSWSASGSTPAVTISTADPVTIVGSRIRNLDGGDLIKGVNWQIPRLTMERTFLYGGTGRVFDAEGCQQVTVRNCTIDKTSGMKIVTSAAATILITRNKQRNIQGAPGYLSAFFKVAESSTSTTSRTPRTSSRCSSPRMRRFMTTTSSTTRHRAMLTTRPRRGRSRSTTPTA
jgi:hypothetical protein